MATVLGSQERGRRGRLLIADLAESHDSGPEGAGGWELTVTPLTAEPPGPKAVRALLAWSADVGYRRVWLPDRVVATHPSTGRFYSRAKVRCETCGTTWRNGGHGFWSRVSKYRCFPMSCQFCGSDLPVWEVRTPRGPRDPRGRDPLLGRSSQPKLEQRSMDGKEPVRSDRVPTSEPASPGTRSPMTGTEAREWIEQLPWRAVQQVPVGETGKCPDPHEYVILGWREVDRCEFGRFVNLIRAEGYRGRYTPPYRPDAVMTNDYLQVGEWIYWFIYPRMLNRQHAEHRQHTPAPEQPA